MTIEVTYKDSAVNSKPAKFVFSFQLISQGLDQVLVNEEETENETASVDSDNSSDLIAQQIA